MQSLVYALPERETAQKNVNIGIIQPLESPFNLFLNLHQLVDPDKRFVYFFIYSIGARKVILWGVYDKHGQDFHIDNACRYRTDQLYGATMHWIKLGYNYVGNTVLNRPEALISKYSKEGMSLEEYQQKRGLISQGEGPLAGLASRSLDRPKMDYPEYVQKKYLLALLNGEISEEDYLRKYQQLPDLPEDPYELYEYIFDLEKEIKKYEPTINRSDLGKVDQSLQVVLTKIMNRFNEAVARGTISTKEFESILQQCPYIQECNKSLTESCSVYFYGQPEYGLLYPEDVQALL